MEFVKAKYYVESELPLEKAAQVIAAEQSTGTWVDVSTKPSDLDARLAARVVGVDEEKGTCDIDFPLEIFEISNIPQFLATVAGNLFGLEPVKNVKLLDIELPKSFAREFKGPRFGIEGIRKLVGTERDGRPHIGTIIKPKVGLNPKQTADVAYDAAMGGCDLIKDDETLTDQKFCPMEERLSGIMEKLDSVKQETGRTVLYAHNITSGLDIVERAERAVEGGANMLMIDVLTSGFSAIQAVRAEQALKVPIHVHRTMHGALTRNPRHGIAMTVISKLTRLAGGDQLHTGTVSGKMERSVEELVAMNDFLKGGFHGLKNVFPVASGGIHPLCVEPEVKTLGNDLVIQAGGGIHGHPDGTVAGARAMRQALDAVMSKIPLKEYAKDHKELARAIGKWGGDVSWSEIYEHGN
ncbi:MAG: ribulose 1,5-bisphosphate carboxylase [Thermoplasmata archaeon HGW-Thermoplasmata-1]|nr:MAG: ribulose 1,5-bisphosphate carboxylase [Thermoplasmata archaeon HGW-Thermoplasmata-1]